MLINRVDRNENIGLRRLKSRRVSISVIQTTSVISIDIPMNKQQQQQQLQQQQQQQQPKRYLSYSGEPTEEERDQQQQQQEKESSDNGTVTQNIGLRRRRRGLSLPLITTPKLKHDIQHRTRRLSRYYGTSLDNYMQKQPQFLEEEGTC